MAAFPCGLNQASFANLLSNFPQKEPPDAMDSSINGVLISEDEVMEYTQRRNLNRGYMKLDVWQRGMDLLELGFQFARQISDCKLKSQFADAVQSAPANIAEGYSRRTLAEYLQFLYLLIRHWEFSRTHFSINPPIHFFAHPPIH